MRIAPIISDRAKTPSAISAMAKGTRKRSQYIAIAAVLRPMGNTKLE